MAGDDHRDDQGKTNKNNGHPYHLDQVTLHRYADPEKEMSEDVNRTLGLGQDQGLGQGLAVTKELYFEILEEDGDTLIKYSEMAGVSTEEDDLTVEATMYLTIITVNEMSIAVIEAGHGVEVEIGREAQVKVLQHILQVLHIMRVQAGPALW